MSVGGFGGLVIKVKLRHKNALTSLSTLVYDMVLPTPPHDMIWAVSLLKRVLRPKCNRGFLISLTQVEAGLLMAGSDLSPGDLLILVPIPPTIQKHSLSIV